MDKKVLIIEFNNTLAKAQKRKIETVLNLEVVIAKDFEEAETIVVPNPEDFFVAIVDINSYEDNAEYILDLLLINNISTIIFTSGHFENTRKFVKSKNVVDYIFKDGINAFTDVVDSIKKLINNISKKIAVVVKNSDDRLEIVSMLNVHKYNVVELSTGQEIIELIKKDFEFKLIILNYSLPDISGFDVVKELRKIRNKDDLFIVGITSRDNDGISAGFLKSGANDFLTKPFLKEEFYCRIGQNLDLMERIEKITKLSNLDDITGVYNIKYLFDAGTKLYENAKRNSILLTYIIFDIDSFKTVYEKYGHYGSEMILREFAQYLKNKFRGSDIVARIDADRFGILTVNMYDSSVLEVLTRIKDEIKDLVFKVNKVDKVNITVSIGVSTFLGGNFESMTKNAEDMLYIAKKHGPNHVKIDY